MPTLAWAQGSVAGVVRDPSGAVLPGVVVSATSSALIERSRTALTDGAGLYRITELPPGAYALSFSLAGFTTLHVEDVEVRGAAVATVDVELRLGALEETISVRARPTVDVQSARRQVVLDSDTVQSLPSTRAYGALLNAVPSLQGGLFATQIRQQIVHFNAYGGRPNEGRLQLDGFNVGTAFNGGGVSGFSYDTANAAELQVTLSGGLGEAEVGSAHMNMVPRSGGNTFSATGFFSQAGEWSQGDNLDDELRAFCQTHPGSCATGM
jgi:hypothetical protein